MRLKPALNGLISMGRVGYGPKNSNAALHGIPGTSLEDLIAKRNAFDGVVINVAWSQLQPEGPQSLDRSPIDSALEHIRAYNHDPLTHVKLRAILRVWAGIVAPDWAKSLGGPPVIVFSNMPDPGRENRTVGRVWSAPYRRAWRSLQDQLGDIYDSEPLIAQISNTSCTTDDDEPNAISRDFDAAADISSLAHLHQAGLSDTVFLDCLKGSPQDYSHWPTTFVNATFGAVFRTDGVLDYQHPPRDPAIAVALIHMWRAGLGPRAVLSNHNLSYGLNPRQLPIYRALAQSGPPLSFQTHSPNGLDWPGTVKAAICLGADSLEVWNMTNKGGFMALPTETLVGWSHELKSRANRQDCTKMLP